MIPIASGLRTQLANVLKKPEFDLTQMTMMELQEQQTHQYHSNQALNINLTRHQQDIDLLKMHLAQRDVLCETLKQKCTELILENTQLKASLTACSDEQTAQRFHQLHEKITVQQDVIKQLKRDNENERTKAQTCLQKNRQLEEENERLKAALKKTEGFASSTESAPPMQKNSSTQAHYYASPLKSTLPQPNNTTTPVLPVSKNTMELKSLS